LELHEAGRKVDKEVHDVNGGGCERYEENVFAEWAYTRALWAFRKKGDTKETAEALEDAIETNPYVPLYLLGHKSLPRTLPDLMSLGDESEAVSYVATALTAWLRTPSALEWLRGNVDQELLRVPALDIFEDQDDPTPLAFVVGKQKPGHGRILGQRGGDPGLSLREVLSQLAYPDYELSTHRRHEATVHEGVDRYAQRRSPATPEPVDDLRRDGYAGGAWCCGTFHARG
jgi:hypothetical protein